MQRALVGLSRTYIIGKAREIGQLRQSLKGYADYDEIKRELEIMKVWSRNAFLVICAHGLCSMSSLLALKVT